MTMAKSTSSAIMDYGRNNNIDNNNNTITILPVTLLALLVPE